MADKLHLKPAPGLVVRDPETGRALADKGEYKRRKTYWLRRLRDGDVIDMDAKKAPSPQPSPVKGEGAKTGDK